MDQTGVGAWLSHPESPSKIDTLVGPPRLYIMHLRGSCIDGGVQAIQSWRRTAISRRCGRVLSCEDGFFYSLPGGVEGLRDTERKPFPFQCRAIGGDL